MSNKCSCCESTSVCRRCLTLRVKVGLFPLVLSLMMMMMMMMMMVVVVVVVVVVVLLVQGTVVSSLATLHQNLRPKTADAPTFIDEKIFNIKVSCSFLNVYICNHCIFTIC